MDRKSKSGSVAHLDSLVALGVSVGLDVLGWDSTGRRVAEEVAKLVGAVVWSSFPAAVIVRHLRRAGKENSPR